MRKHKWEYRRGDYKTPVELDYAADGKEYRNMY